MKLLEQYLAKRQMLAESITALQDAAAAEDRDLTDAENTTADDLLHQVEELDVRIDSMQRAESILARHRSTSARGARSS